MSKQITLLDLPVGKGGFIIADPFIIATAVQQGSGWIGALHKRELIFLHRLGSSKGGFIKSTPLLTQPSGYLLPLNTTPHLLPIHPATPAPTPPSFTPWFTFHSSGNAQHGFHALGQPPTPPGFYALLGSSPSPPQGRPGELPLFLLDSIYMRSFCGALGLLCIVF